MSPNTREVDVLVVGSGVAGLSAALGLAATRRVLVVDAAAAGDGGSTRWAQGGIAAAVGPDDSPGDHAADTAVAGADLCDLRALDVLVEEGPQRIADLLAHGAVFDRSPDGELATTLEGGHHRRRVVHAGGDATGAEVARVLARATDRAGVERVRARVSALTVGDGPRGQQVTGAELQTVAGPVHVRARAVVLATGGIGNAYPTSTNPATVTGEGLALALRAGATLADVEFVQFHPTVLYTGADAGQLPLITEALRGEGAVLRDHAGQAFMAGRHPLADLAPRDIVARETVHSMTRTEAAHVWLDATALGADLLAERFPTIVSSCRAVGVDPATDPIPVAPAEHFLCGGIATDRWGATNVTGLFAVGEAAATGVHGANRLASNSLLEGLVFGRRVAARLTLRLPEHVPDGEPAALLPDPAAAEVARAVLARSAGVVRDAAGLAAAATALGSCPGPDPTWLVASAVVAAATLRQESRGAHYRTDHRRTHPRWRCRIDVCLDRYGVPRADVAAGGLLAGRAA